MTNWSCGKCGLQMTEGFKEHDCIVALQERVSEFEQAAKIANYRLKVLGKCCRTIRGAVAELEGAMRWVKEEEVT